MTQTEEIEYLKERVRQLEAALLMGVDFPLNWRLTRTETKMLRLLYRRQHASKDQIMLTLYGNMPAPPGEQLINVYACKLRKKLTPLGIEIKTLVGVGYAIDGSSKAKLREYLKADGVAV